MQAKKLFMQYFNNQPISVPSHREILKEITRQLHSRKSILAQRIAFILWPFLLLIVFTLIGEELYNRQIVTKDSIFFIPAIIFYAVWFVFSILYLFLTKIVFFIEKLVWIDSYFDQKNLDPKTSWRIAKKLFLPALILRLRLFKKYYFFPIVLFFIAVLAVSLLLPYSYFDHLFGFASEPILTTIVFGVGLITLIIYTFYLRLKFRFVWFLFLDLYGTKDFSYKSLFQELEKIHEVSKKDTFKKTFAIHLKAIFAEAMTDSAISAITRDFSTLGKWGKLFGALFKTTAQETSQQVISFGKIIAIYLLYRYARSALYSNPQSVNQYIYKL